MNMSYDTLVEEISQRSTKYYNFLHFSLERLTLETMVKCIINTYVEGKREAK